MEYKAKGNELFKTNQLIEARDLYTKALQYCPFDKKDTANNKDYAVILANRSACTDKIGLFEAAVQDIDDALRYGYPKTLQYKVNTPKNVQTQSRKVFYIFTNNDFYSSQNCMLDLEIGITSQRAFIT